MLVSPPSAPNARVAQALASIVHAYLRDRAMAGCQRPLYVVELACHDRPMGPMLLHHLARMIRDTPSLPDFRYVVALPDHEAVARSSHEPALHPWLERGGVDLGRMEIGGSPALTLSRAGQRMQPGELDALLVIAHHALGVLPQRPCAVAGGVAEPGPAADTSDDPLDDELVLACYPRRLSDARFLLPVGAFRALDALQELSGGHLILVTTDAGAEEFADLEGASRPDRTALDHAALRLYASIRGALVESEGGLAGGRVSSFVVFGGPGEVGGTRAAWRLAVASGAMDGAPPTEVLGDGPPFAACLRALRASAWDPVVFHRLAPELLASLPSAGPAERRALARGAGEVEAQLLTTHDPLDVWFDLGCVQAGMQPEAAIRAFETSVTRNGSSFARSFNLAKCASALGRSAAAEAHLRAALRQVPGHPVASQALDAVRGAATSHHLTEPS